MRSPDQNPSSSFMAVLGILVGVAVAQVALAAAEAPLTQAAPVAGTAAVAAAAASASACLASTPPVSVNGVAEHGVRSPIANQTMLSDSSRPVFRVALPCHNTVKCY